jgi:hypothetical protein
MLEHHLPSRSSRGFVVAVCFALLAGCGEDAATVETPSAPGPVAPSPPASLVATAGNTQVGLAWSSSTAATGYRIKRSAADGGPYVQLASVSSTAYTDSTVVNGTTFYYVVAAVNSAGEGAASSQASATPSAPPPPPPPPVLTAPSDVSATAGNGLVALSWSEISGATSYRVRRSTTSGGPYAQVSTPTSPSFTDTSLSNGTTYYYVVSAVYPTGESGNSSQIAASPVAPVVSGNCSSLAAPGQWQEISPPGMAKSVPYAGALVTLVDPNNSGTLYVTTSGSGVFKSTDCGASWVKTNTGRNGSQIDQGLVWSAQLDPVDSKILYVITGYGPSGVWKSTNGGVDWDNILPSNIGLPGFVARVSMDPTDHLHLIINFHENCTGTHTAVCFGETKDGGKTWTILNFPTALKNGWGEGTFVLPMDATHWLYEAFELYYTADAGKTWKRVDTGGALDMQGPFYRDPSGSYWLASYLGIITSADGENWTRIPNSFNAMDAITGCGNSLYAANGFQPPAGNDYIYTATFANPTAWSILPTPGMPAKMVSGANSITCDTSRNIIYVSGQASGLWRAVAPR